LPDRLIKSLIEWLARTLALACKCQGVQVSTSVTWRSTWKRPTIPANPSNTAPDWRWLWNISLSFSMIPQHNFKQKERNKMNRYSKKEDSSPLPGAGYIRYSSEMQSDSFSLDAQLRQIKEQAERDGVNIVQVFSDPAQSAYRKKFRPGINAMREAARQGDSRFCLFTRWTAWHAGWNGRWRSSVNCMNWISFSRQSNSRST